MTVKTRSKNSSSAGFGAMHSELAKLVLYGRDVPRQSEIIRRFQIGLCLRWIEVVRSNFNSQ